jgi:RNA polymerase sigma factor (sigma-70 family)
VPATDQDVDEERERRFRTLYEQHYRAVHAYAVRRTGAPDDASDAVAEVFTTAWRRLDSVPAAPADLLWLYGVARRVLATQHRGARRRSRLVARIESGYGRAPEAPEPEPDDRLLTALARLPEREREALLLVLWEDLSHAEAAQVLGCSANAVAIRVHRAKTRLRAALAPAREAIATRS